MLIEKQTVIVMHAHQVWKGRFFASIPEALGVVRMYYAKTAFRSTGSDTIISIENGGIFKAKVLEAYEGMNQLMGERIM